MIWTFAIPALVLLATALLYPSRRRPADDDSGSIAGRVSLLLLSCLLLLMFAGITFMIHSAGFCLMAMAVIAVSLFIRLPKWGVVPLLVVLGGALYYQPVQFALHFRKEIHAYQQQYPLESLSERLAYETAESTRNWQYVSTSSARAAHAASHGLPCGTVLPASPATGSEETLPLLTDIRKPLRAPPAPGTLAMFRISWDGTFDEIPTGYFSEYGEDRRDALRVVHDRWTGRFNQILGNGVFRMPFMRDWQDHLEEDAAPEKLYLPDEYTPADQFAADVLAARELQQEWKGTIHLSNAAADWDQQETERGWKSPEAEQLGLIDPEFHSRSVIDFVNRPGWGYVRSREEVAGFRSHRFRYRPVVMNPTTEQVDDWRITKLELVSLLKHDTPQVYLEEGLPNLETMSSEEIPTRDLDGFERKALRFIQQGEDVVFDEHPQQIRMLGSLRAVGECLQCHEVPDQTLLGAFTYELRKSRVSVSLR